MSVRCRYTLPYYAALYVLTYSRGIWVYIWMYMCAYTSFLFLNTFFFFVRMLGWFRSPVRYGMSRGTCSRGCVLCISRVIKVLSQVIFLAPSAAGSICITSLFRFLSVFFLSCYFISPSLFFLSPFFFTFRSPHLIAQRLNRCPCDWEVPGPRIILLCFPFVVVLHFLSSFMAFCRRCEYRRCARRT